MVLTLEEHLFALAAINTSSPPPWLDQKFRRNWQLRKDFENSTHLEACAIDRELHLAIKANMGLTNKMRKANDYNCEVVYNADDDRYFELPSLAIYDQMSGEYQWDSVLHKPSQVGGQINGVFAYDWDPSNTRRKKLRKTKSGKSHQNIWKVEKDIIFKEKCSQYFKRSYTDYSWFRENNFSKKQFCWWHEPVRFVSQKEENYPFLHKTNVKNICSR